MTVKIIVVCLQCNGHVASHGFFVRIIINCVQIMRKCLAHRHTFFVCLTCIFPDSDSYNNYHGFLLFWCKNDKAVATFSAKIVFFVACGHQNPRFLVCMVRAVSVCSNNPVSISRFCCTPKSVGNNFACILGICCFWGAWRIVPVS